MLLGPQKQLMLETIKPVKSAGFNYSTFMSNDGILFDDSTIRLMENTTCFGFMGDTIAEYYYRNSACQVASSFRTIEKTHLTKSETLDKMHEREYVYVLLYKNEHAVAAIKEVARNWNFGIEIYQKNMTHDGTDYILIKGKTKEVWRTKWMLQAILQIYRTVYKCNTPITCREDLTKVHIGYSAYWDVFKLGQVKYDFADKCFEYIDNDYYEKNGHTSMVKASQQVGILTLLPNIFKQLEQKDVISKNS